MRAAVLSENFSVQIFLNFFLSWIIKNIGSRSFRNLFKWSPHFSISFSKPAGIPTVKKSTTRVRWVSTRTQISVKSETDFKYFCQGMFCLNFRFTVGLALLCIVRTFFYKTVENKSDVNCALCNIFCYKDEWCKMYFSKQSPFVTFDDAFVKVCMHLLVHY